jgi:hypothetical protein
MDLSLSLHAIRDLFSFPFKDPRWVSKFLIGTGILLAGFVIPVLPWLIVWGYIARVIRAGAANEDPTHLPEWDDWGDLLMDGLRQFGVVLCYILPAAIIMGIGWTIYTAGIFSITGYENDPYSGPGRAVFFIFAMLVLFLSMGIGLLLILLAVLVMPAAQAHTAVNRRFSAAFNLSGWWRILRANLSGFLIGAGTFVVLQTLLGFVFQFLYMTLVLCLFAPFLMFPASLYIMIVSYRIIGQAYWEGRQKSATKLESGPPAPAELKIADGTAEGI